MPGLLELIYEGSIFTIWAYKKDSGEIPAVELMEELSENFQVKFASLFTQLGNQGKIYNEKKFKHLTRTEKLFEFKVDNARIFSFFASGRRVILTHGFVEKNSKTPKGEIMLAEKIKKEFERRSCYGKS
jgi:phage-related protein